MGAFLTHLTLCEGLTERSIEIFPDSLGITRAKMPQIHNDLVSEFLEGLKKQGISVRPETVSVSSLKPTQREMDRSKVEGMLKSAPDRALNKPIIVSNDNRILDGHHRWAAKMSRNPVERQQVWRVGLSIRKLLERASSFSKVEYKPIAA